MDHGPIDRFIRRAAHPHAVSEAEPLLVLVGPTAGGKTTLSLKIAEDLILRGKGVEIINADSRQLYTSMDIGTGKIKREEMRGIPHHLIDVLDPREEVTAAWYKREAERVIGEIHRRGNIPLLVGGSMLYVSAVIDNLRFVECSHPHLRRDLMEDLQREGAESLHRRLQELDPEGAMSIDPRNTVYLLRALEVCITSGMTLKDAKRKSPSPYDLFILGVEVPRSQIRRRIAERTEKMFAEGWIAEVAGLLKRGYAIDDPGMRSIGYREIAEAVRMQSAEGADLIARLKPLIIAQTCQYAKRQMTWWRRDPRIHWITPQAANRS